MLTETVAQIETREDFVAFLHELRGDLRAHPEAWENATLDAYLEAMAAWTEDADGYYAREGSSMPRQPSWKLIAEILLAATCYE
jgi:hypothetical protein